MRRTIIEDPRCDRCLGTSENPHHAQWSCKELDSIWADSKLWGFRSSIQFQNFKEALSWIIGQGQYPDLFAAMIWDIWFQRNNVRLHKPECALHQVPQIARDIGRVLGWSDHPNSSIPFISSPQLSMESTTIEACDDKLR